jgi:uncharacterized protein HemX
MPAYSIPHEAEEDTQPLEPNIVEASQFDETVKDTQELTPVIDQSTRVTDKIPALTDADLADEDTLPVAPPAARAEPKRPVLRWALVVVLALGAAGAWFFWNQQQTVSEGTRSSTQR